MGTKRSQASHPADTIFFFLLFCRYVEMLEEQQMWLIHDLKELYRRSIDLSGPPGQPSPNGYPLIHDLLMRLGTLDNFEGERFGDNPGKWQMEHWRNGIPCLKSTGQHKRILNSWPRCSQAVLLTLFHGGLCRRLYAPAAQPSAPLPWET